MLLQERFLAMLDLHGAHHPAAFRASLGAALESLPEHCVHDVEGYTALRWLGAALLAVQLLSGYASLTAFVFVAKKAD